MFDNKILIESLNKLLLKHGIKAQTLSKECNLSGDTVAKIISGKLKSPSVKTLLPIANYFDITLNELVSGKSYIPASDENIDLKIFKTAFEIVIRQLEEHEVDVSVREFYLKLNDMYNNIKNVPNTSNKLDVQTKKLKK